jgi:hypothetical protein
MTKLPELTQDMREIIRHVDATPDGKYAIRILKCYLERANVKFKVDGNTADNELFNFMNECQDKRVVELEKAIKTLEGKE